MADTVPVTVIRHGTRFAALVTTDAAVLAPWIRALERDHPVRRFVSLKCLVAREMQLGPDAEPYDGEIADFYTRVALLPDEEFDPLAGRVSDASLAEYFNVPLEHVARKRRDRELCRDRLFRPR
jgi:hypothetical protein